jgi:predicted MFS family arabinose efflux permease
MGLDWGTINAARLVGPVIGGTLYEWLGIGAWLAACGVMYLGSTLAVTGIGAAPPPAGLDPADKGRKIFASMVDDVVASFRDPMVAGVLAVTIAMNFFGFVYSSMVPVIGKEVLNATPPEVGLLSSMEGIGALVAAGLIAGVARPVWFGRLFLIGSMMTLVGALCFSRSGSYGFSLAVLTGAGMGSAIFATMQSTLILISVPAERRSRAMGVMTTTIGIGQTGVLWLGALAGWFGAATAVAISAGVGIALLLTFAALWPAMWRAPGTAHRL